MTLTEKLTLIAKVLGGSAMLGCVLLILTHAVGRVDIDWQTLLLGPGLIVGAAAIILHYKLGY